MSDPELTEAELEKFRDLIYRVAGIRIGETKRLMVTNRLRRRLRATGVPSFAAYYALLTSAAGGAEMPLFLDAITTNETCFFRDPHNYEWLGGTFLPSLISEARLGRRERSLRIWSAACATGEELYSVALKVRAHQGALTGWRVTLLGTDISGAALEAARAGTYDERALRLIAAGDRDAHFDHDPAQSRWALKPEVRRMTTWASHNLLDPMRGGPFDCIVLKNVLIYFDQDSKRRVVANLLAVLAPGGYLVIGPTEGVHNLLSPLVRRESWLYQGPA